MRDLESCKMVNENTERHHLELLLDNLERDKEFLELKADMYDRAGNLSYANNMRVLVSKLQNEITEVLLELDEV